MTPPDAAVLIAGGRGLRLGGRDKPALLVGGRSLLDLALTAVSGGVVALAGRPVVVVGPARELPAGVLQTVEDPPGGGPAAGMAAGVAALSELPGGAVVAVLAADLPGITASTVARLSAALGSASSAVGGAVLIDPGGRRQYLIGVWRLAALQRSISRRETWHDVSLKEMLAPIQVVEIPGSAGEASDIDEPADLQQWQS